MTTPPGSHRSGASPEPPPPDVSIIVITYNAAGLLSECLDSVRRSAGDVRVEIIVVDNGSTDGSAEMVTRSFPEVRLVRLPSNEGLPARNHGLRIAGGRHRMFLDSDAELTVGALPALVAELDDHPETGLVGPRLVYPDGRLQLSTRRYPPLLLPVLRLPGLADRFEGGRTMRRHLMADDPHDVRRPVEYVLGACQLFRAEAQAAAGEIDRRIWFGHDDADWCFRIREAGYQVMYLPDAQVVHHYKRAAAARPLSMHTLRFLGAHLYFQAKWRGRRRKLRSEGAAMDREATLGR